MQKYNREVFIIQQILKNTEKKSFNLIKDYILNTEPTLEAVINAVGNESRIQNKQEFIDELNKLKSEQATANDLRAVNRKLAQYQSFRDSFRKKYLQINIAQGFISNIKSPKEFKTTNNADLDTPQIKNSNIGLLFSNNSNYQNPSLNIQPREYPFKRQIINYNTPSTNKFGVQDIIYTSLINKNFMRSEPNSVVFWSKCDFSEDALQNLRQENNDFWNPSFTQNIWGNNRNDTFDNRNTSNLQDSSLKGDQVSDTIAHSLNRHTLRDVWRYNIDGGTTVRGNNNVPVFNEMSRLLAERASGEVIFVSGDKDSTTNKYGNTWENIEKPTLMKNLNVTMIVEIDAKNPRKVKTITFPHGITKEIKTKYPIFASLKKQIHKIDYTLNPTQYIDFTERSITNPLIRDNPVHVKRPKSPVKPLQLRNSRQINDKKIKRTNSMDSLNL